MSKTITVETDPADVLNVLQTDPAAIKAMEERVQAALDTRLPAAMGKVKIRIPKSTVEAITEDVMKSIGATGTTSPADASAIAEAIWDTMQEEVAKAKPASKPALVSAKGKVTKVAAIAAADKAANKITRNCWKYGAPGLRMTDGKWFIKFCGDPGSAKTYLVREFGETAGFDLVIEVACLSDMEPKDFIGGNTVVGDGSGGFIFIDGPLARAWRAAAAGQTVCIILDEIGNVPRKAKQAFQTATSPFGAEGDEKLLLQTGKPIKGVKGDYHIEEIIAPMANITIIGTQNVGPKFDCEPDSPAIRARFKSIPVGTDAKLIRDVVGTRIKALWKKSASDITKALVAVWDDAKRAQEKSLLDLCPSIREFLHIVNTASHVSDADAWDAIAKELMADGNKEWFVADGHDGAPMIDQVKCWKEIVSKRFPAKRK